MWQENMKTWVMKELQGIFSSRFFCDSDKQIEIIPGNPDWNMFGTTVAPGCPVIVPEGQSQFFCSVLFCFLIL